MRHFAEGINTVSFRENPFVCHAGPKKSPLDVIHGLFAMKDCKRLKFSLKASREKTGDYTKSAFSKRLSYITFQKALLYLYSPEID